MKTMIKQKNLLLLFALFAGQQESLYPAAARSKFLTIMNGSDAAAAKAFYNSSEGQALWGTNPGWKTQLVAKFPTVNEVIVRVAGPSGGSGPTLTATQGIVDVAQVMQDAISSGDIQKVATTFNLLSNQKLTGDAFKTLQGFKTTILTTFAGTFSSGPNGFDQYTPPGGVLPPPPPVLLVFVVGWRFS